MTQRLLDRIQPVAGLTQHGDARFGGQHHGQAPSDQGLVIDDEQAQGRFDGRVRKAAHTPGPEPAVGSPGEAGPDA